MGYTRQAIKGISWVGAVRIVIRGLAILKTALIARILTPFQFGLFGITTLVFALIDIITETGINVFLVQQKDDINKYIHTAWLVSIVRGIVMASLIVITSPFIANFFNNQNTIPLLFLMSFVPLIKGFINPSIIKFQKEMQFGKDFIYKTSIFLVETIFSVTLVFLMESPIGLVWGMIISALFEVYLSFQMMNPTPKFKFEKIKFLEIIHHGKWITLSGIFNYLFQHTDDVMVGKLLGTSSLGLYDMAYRISLVPIYDLSDTISRVTFPVYVKISDDIKRLRIAFFKSMSLLAIVTTIVGLILFFYPEQIISLLLGSQWVAVAGVLKILAIFGFFKAFSTASSVVFLSVGKQNIVSLISIIGFLGLLVTIVPFVNMWGLQGAAFAALFGTFLTLPITFYFLYKNLY